MSEERSTFVASARTPDSEETAEGRILLDRLRLRFLSASVSLEIPLTRLELELDDTAGGRVQFRDPAQPGCSVDTFDLSVLDHSALLAHPHTRNQLGPPEGSSNELKRRLKLVLWFLVGFAILAAGVSFLMGVMVRSLVARVPPQMEQELGDSMLADLESEYLPVEDAQAMTKLTNSVAPLLAALPPSSCRYQFHIVGERLPNAFSLPGGHVLVTTGLLRLVGGPEELEAVVAHEIAHVNQRHVFRQLISSAGPAMIFELFFNGRGLSGLFGAGSALLVSRGFSQEYELEADAVGWDYLVAARIDPRTMISLLRKLQAAESRQPLSDLEPRAFSTHPATEKRIRRLEAKWRHLRNKEAFGASL